MSTVIDALSPIKQENYNLRMAAAILVTGALISQGGKVLPAQSLNFPVATAAFAGATAFYAGRAALEGLSTYNNWNKETSWGELKNLKEMLAAASIAGFILAAGTVSAVNTKLPSMISYSVDGDFGKAFGLSAAVAAAAYFAPIGGDK